VTSRIRLGVALSELGRATRRRGRDSDAPSQGLLASFCSALSSATNLEIVPYAAPRYDRLLHRLKQGEVELGWLAPVVALMAMRAEVAPVALPVRGETPWYWAALYVRNDSELHSLANLHRARVVWVDRDSASGYLVMRAALHADGFDVERGFAEQSFEKTHDAVLRAVLADPLAVGATYLHLDGEGKIARAGWGDAAVRELKRAGPIPSDVLAAASTLPVKTVDALRTALCDNPGPELREPAEALFGARSFVAADRAQLAHLHALERYLIHSQAR
jgi:ABC-type phosphate/phosphonate transport system substrate-binding protein